MDKYLYLAMNGASQAMQAQQANANNLANVSTVGFKATLDHFEAKPVYGPGHADRVYTNDKVAGADFRQGSVMTTGRDLDITINGDGWFAVQTDDGSVGYSRRGDLRIDPNGLLTNGANQIAIVIPCHRVIGADGSLTGYGGGLWRKRWLIGFEKGEIQPPSDIIA